MRVFLRGQGSIYLLQANIRVHLPAELLYPSALTGLVFASSRRISFAAVEVALGEMECPLKAVP